MKAFDEFGLIAHLVRRVPLRGDGVLTGVGDDAAVLEVPPGEHLLVSTDAMVDGVHFLPTTMRPADVGYKAASSTISDVAAMGGRAHHLVIALAIPEGARLADLEALYDGLGEACRDHGVTVVGGDVIRTSGPLVVTCTVIGSVASGGAVLRGGARPGDVVFVTGTVGASGAGLALLLDGTAAAGDVAAELIESHRRPRAQIWAGAILREAGATSLDDISDGLASELNEISRASGVRLRIEARRVPVAPSVRDFARLRGEDPMRYAWYGGEDYQLVGTAPAFAFARALTRCEAVGIRLTQIGRVEAGDGVIVETDDGRLEVLEPRGFNHFAPRDGEPSERVPGSPDPPAERGAGCGRPEEGKA
ncbi:thiamine-phosphate kinase [Alicyclobacillus sp.]|uniref:thiamine-phosphate kinase n=1 Tax=Alicyclobacillus sp. TaxID=61169 RepID=UPI0025BF81E5|nr:thiamine-phosphate kinase [Alicyclobacillus sp.]MCL6517495.1 thiamine-phosphate kinase [Alicyclobacillus sp.]